MGEVVQPVRKSGCGCGKALAIGCLSVLLLAAVGSFLAYRGVKGFIANAVTQYTDPAPRALPVTEAPQAEAAALVARVKAFGEELRQERAASDLVLTARDINILLGRNPGWAGQGGAVRVDLEGDKLRGQVSMALKQAPAPFKDRYLNGSAVFRVDLTAGRLNVFMDAVEVRGKALPETIMHAVRNENLAEKAAEEPETARFLAKIETVVVRDGTLRIVPKRSP